MVLHGLTILESAQASCQGDPIQISLAEYVFARTEITQIPGLLAFLIGAFFDSHRERIIVCESESLNGFRWAPCLVEVSLSCKLDCIGKPCTLGAREKLQKEVAPCPSIFLGELKLPPR